MEMGKDWAWLGNVRNRPLYDMRNRPLYAMDIPTELAGCWFEAIVRLFNGLTSDSLTIQDADAINSYITAGLGSAAGAGTWVNGSPCN
jgi:hypothetical protein